MAARLKSIAALLFPALVWGQSFTATLRGLVTDPAQAAVPGATVTATEVNRNLEHTTRTDRSGRYILTALPPGTYKLTVEANGFEKYQRGAFALEVQQDATIDIPLALGSTTATVDVQGIAPLLNTASATLGQVIENKFMMSAPLVNRTALSLVMLTPGVVPTDTSAGGTADTNFVANGTVTP